MTRRRLAAALAPVYLSVFLFVAGSSALSLLVPVYLSRNADVGPAAIGAIVSVYGIASLVARLPVGLAYSTARATPLLLAGGALSAAAFALVPLFHGPLALAALIGLNGLGWSIASTAQLALLVARPPAGMTTGAAMGWFAGATGLGNAAAVLGGICADQIGLGSTFFVLAATPLIGAALMARGVSASAALSETPPPQKAQGRAWRALLHMPLAVWAGVLVMFFINGLNAITNTFHPVLALGAGLSLTQIGALSSIRSWASSSSRFGSGPLFSRVDPGGLTMPLVIAGTLATCLIPSAIGSFLLQIPLFVLAGLSRGLLRVTGAADAFDAGGREERRHGLISALLYGGLDTGKIVLPLLGGLVAHVWSIETMFRVVPAGLLLFYLALAVPAGRAKGTATVEAG